MTKKSPTWIQSWSQRVPKSIKNLLTSKSGPQGVLLGVLGGFRMNRMVIRAPKITRRDVKMHLPGSRVAKMEPRVSQIVNQPLARRPLQSLRRVSDGCSRRKPACSNCSGNDQVLLAAVARGTASKTWPAPGPLQPLLPRPHSISHKQPNS